MEKDLFIRLGCFLDFASKTAQNHPKPIHLQFQETKGVMKGDFPPPNTKTQESYNWEAFSPLNPPPVLQHQGRIDLGIALLNTPSGF